MNVKNLTPVEASAHIFKAHYNKNTAFTKSIRELDVELMTLKSKQPIRIAAMTKSLHKLVLKADEDWERMALRTEEQEPIKQKNKKTNGKFPHIEFSRITRSKAKKANSREQNAYNLRSKRQQ